VTESDEEAVVSKTARVKEEVVVHKEATDRVETVRDTVRRQDVEIERDDSTSRTSGGAPMPATPARAKI
jgi:stress response protein YsnF